MNFKKIQKLGLSYFRGKNYFAGDDGIQNYLVFQPMSKYFKTHAVPNIPVVVLLFLFIFQNGNLNDCLKKIFNVSLHIMVMKYWLQN